jgi:hypothetical protein
VCVVGVSVAALAFKEAVLAGAAAWRRARFWGSASLGAFFFVVVVVALASFDAACFHPPTLRPTQDDDRDDPTTQGEYLTATADKRERKRELSTGSTTKRRVGFLF